MSLLSGSFDDFAALILTALHADAVGDLGFIAIGALRGSGLPQGIMGAARCGALSGMSSFRIRHFVLLVFSGLS